MRMHGIKARRFQLGGANFVPPQQAALGPAAAGLGLSGGAPGGIQPSPQQLAAMQARRQMMQGGAGAPGGQMGPMAQRGAMPTPGPGAAPMLGAAAPGTGGMPGGGPPPGAGGQAMLQGVPGAAPRPGAGGMMGGPPPGPLPGGGSMFGAAPQGGVPAPGGGGGMFGAAPQGMQANPQLMAALAQQQGMMGMAKGGRVKTFNSTKAAPGNLATRPGKGKMAEGGEVDEFSSLPEKKAKGGVLKKKPRAAEKKARDKKDASTPAYDKPQAGDDGWPPTPSFTGAPGANAPMPVPAAAPISPTPAGPPGMKKGGKIEKKAKGGECVTDKDGDKMRKGGACDKMAAGGAAKVRRGFPDTIKPGGKKTMKFAKGGGVRGAGAAERGTGFSGIY